MTHICKAGKHKLTFCFLSSLFKFLINFVEQIYLFNCIPFGRKWVNSTGRDLSLLSEKVTPMKETFYGTVASDFLVKSVKPNFVG